MKEILVNVLLYTGIISSIVLIIGLTCTLTTLLVKWIIDIIKEK